MLGFLLLLTVFSIGAWMMAKYRVLIGPVQTSAGELGEVGGGLEMVNQYYVVDELLALIVGLLVIVFGIGLLCVAKPTLFSGTERA